jgi:AraC-like DNA-binding protein/quercetin dioxygenase-like cupin family protein
MSRKRQATVLQTRISQERVPIRTFSVRCPSGFVIPKHAHDWHQLIYATQGVMSVYTRVGAWVIPPHRAVWVPAGIEHSIEMSGSVLVQTLYVAAGLANALPKDCCAVNISPLLRELIQHVFTLKTLDTDIPSQSRLIAVLLDQLEVLPTIPLQLPMPRDRRAERVSAWLRANPRAPGLLKQLRKTAGASIRTIERRFRAETGMTFGKWRQQLRLLEALRRLAAGQAVTAVAREVGYDSPSAFIAMFRRALGTTPSRYFLTSVEA